MPQKIRIDLGDLDRLLKMHEVRIEELPKMENPFFRIEVEKPKRRQFTSPPGYGAETEFFILHDGKLVRAANVSPTDCDSNDSIAEVRSEASYNIESIQPNLMKQITRVANAAIGNYGYNFGRNTTFLFAPITHVECDHDGVKFPLFKTAGVHLHTSSVDRSEETRAKVEAKYARIVEKFGELPMLRMQVPVIGPISGTVYNYGKGKDAWRKKSSLNEHWEFRLFPSSSLVLSPDLMRIALTFVQNPDLVGDTELEMLAEASNQPAARSVLDFIPNRTVNANMIRLGRGGYVEEWNTTTLDDVPMASLSVISFADTIHPKFGQLLGKAGECIVVPDGHLESAVDLIRKRQPLPYISLKELNFTPEELCTHKIPHATFVLNSAIDESPLAHLYQPLRDKLMEKGYRMERNNDDEEEEEQDDIEDGEEEQAEEQVEVNAFFA